MAKARPKTPATTSAAEKDEKAGEQASAASAAAAAAAAAAEAEAAAAGPYLLSFDALNRIFGSLTTTTEAGAEAKAPAAQWKTTAQKFLLLQQVLGVQHFDANPRTTAWVDFCFGVLCFARNENSDSNSDNGDSHSVIEHDDDEKALLLLTIANDIFQFATAPATPTSDNNASNKSAEERGEGLPSVELCYDRFRERVREVSTMVSSPTDNDNGDEPLQNQNQQHDDVVSPNTPPLPPPHPLRKPTLSTAEVVRFVAFMSATFFRHLPAYQFVFRHARPSVTRELELVVEMPFPPPPLAHAARLLLDE